MKPSWLKDDQDRKTEQKARVLSSMRNTDQQDDLEREDAYQDLMEDTGRSY